MQREFQKMLSQGLLDNQKETDRVNQVINDISEAFLELYTHVRYQHGIDDKRVRSVNEKFRTSLDIYLNRLPLSPLINKDVAKSTYKNPDCEAGEHSYSETKDLKARSESEQSVSSGSPWSFFESKHSSSHRNSTSVSQGSGSKKSLKFSDSETADTHSQTSSSPRKMSSESDSAKSSSFEMSPIVKVSVNSTITSSRPNSKASNTLDQTPSSVGQTKNECDKLKLHSSKTSTSAVKSAISMAATSSSETSSNRSLLSGSKAPFNFLKKTRSSTKEHSGPQTEHDIADISNDDSEFYKFVKMFQEFISKEAVLKEEQVVNREQQMEPKRKQKTPAAKPKQKSLPVNIAPRHTKSSLLKLECLLPKRKISSRSKISLKSKPSLLAYRTPVLAPLPEWKRDTAARPEFVTSYHSPFSLHRPFVPACDKYGGLMTRSSSAQQLHYPVPPNTPKSVASLRKSTHRVKSSPEANILSTIRAKSEMTPQINSAASAGDKPQATSNTKAVAKQQTLSVTRAAAKAQTASATRAAAKAQTASATRAAAKAQTVSATRAAAKVPTTSATRAAAKPVSLSAKLLSRFRPSRRVAPMVDNDM